MSGCVSRSAPERAISMLMEGLAFDHVVIHIDDWEACNVFYGEVLGAALVENPEGSNNPRWARGRIGLSVTRSTCMDRGRAAKRHVPLH
jgi:catechol 2,3-dioxygenase-like lactoylglutathione lyase family enzyme